MTNDVTADDVKEMKGCLVELLEAIPKSKKPSVFGAACVLETLLNKLESQIRRDKKEGK